MSDRQHTFIMFKPDAVALCEVTHLLNEARKIGVIIASKLTRMSRITAMQFYEEHSGKSFFEDLVDFTASGPIICAVLEGSDVVKQWREAMGATDPQKALPGTIRKALGTVMPRNAVHGSDSPESAKREIAFAIDHGLL